MPLLETKGAASAQGFGGAGAGASGPVTYIEDVFSTYLYTGQTTATTVINGIDLLGKGGMVWTKTRASVSSNYINYTDSSYPTYVLRTEYSAAQVNDSSSISAWNSNGFTGWRGWDPNALVSWTFRKQAKFFDIVTYTGDGTGTARTLTHNLKATPGLYIIKAISTTGNWYVGVPSLGQNFWGNLNSVSNFGNNTTYWKTATATTFGPESTGATNYLNQSGVTYVAYLFAHNAGGFGLSGTDNVISCGSYTGNGSSTGPVINLGYEPQWVMIKNVNATGGWVIADNMRGLVVGNNDPYLMAQSPNAEDTTFDFISPTETGFKITTSNTAINGSGNTIIYVAIRRGPMRVPTSGTSVFTPITYVVSGGGTGL